MVLHARSLARGALLFGMLAGRPIAAQEMPRAGDSIEARFVGPADSLRGQTCSTALGAVLGDTLLIERSKSCAAGSHVAHVRYARIDRGLRLRRAGLGMLIGVVTGGVTGYATAGCRIEGCDLPDAKSTNAVAGGIALGALGTLVGVAWPIRERWTELEGERQIRVGSFGLRPAIRVSLDERPR